MKYLNVLTCFNKLDYYDVNKFYFHINKRKKEKQLLLESNIQAKTSADRRSLKFYQ